MAEKGWTSQVAAAAGVAAGTGAAQLGLGYGLGVVEWPAVPVDDSVWLGSLGWATWIAASSTVFGAVIASRLGRANGPWRFALAVSAAVGALLTVALIALPARAAVRTDTFSPQTIAGGYAVIGVLLGLVIAYWAVVSRPVAANLIATAAWLWSLAVAAVVTTIFWHRPSATYLSSWQFFSPDTADNRYGTISWPSALLTLLAALIVGIIGVLPAIGRGDLGVGAASSGAVGPLLVAGAFLVLAPQLTSASGPLQSAFLIAPYAVLAGLAGSALMVAIGQRRASRRAGAPQSGPEPAQARAGAAGDDAPPASGAKKAGAVSARTGAGAPGTRSDHGREGAVSVRSESTQGGPTDNAPSGASESSKRPPAERNPGSASKKRAAENVGEALNAPSGGAPAAVSATRGDEEVTEPRPRKSFMDRLRRRKAAADEVTAEQPVIVTGRAKAPAPSPSPTASGKSRSGGQTQPSPAARPDAAAQAGGTTQQGEAVQPRTAARPGAAAEPGANPAHGGARSAAASQPGAGPATPAGSGAGSAKGRRAGGSGNPAAPPAGGGQSGGSAGPGAASSNSARPAARSDARSTVAPPPASPPVAKINGPQSTDKPPAPRKSAPRTSGNSAPGPADAANSDKTPANPKNPAKSTKAAAPAARSATGRTSATKPPAAGQAPAVSARRPDWADEADTAELPVQTPKRRAPRRTDEADTAELPIQDPKQRRGGTADS
jgi:hypothetical protein